MIVGYWLSAPLRRVVQARGSIVKRYIHGARGNSRGGFGREVGEAGEAGEGDGEGFVTRCKDLWVASRERQVELGDLDELAAGTQEGDEAGRLECLVALRGVGGREGEGERVRGSKSETLGNQGRSRVFSVSESRVGVENGNPGDSDEKGSHSNVPTHGQS